MGSLLVPNTCYGVDIPGSVDIISGPLASYAGVMQVGGGKKNKKRKQMRTKKRGSSKRKNKRVSTMRKKKGRTGFKLRFKKYKKKSLVRSIMNGLTGYNRFSGYGQWTIQKSKKQRKKYTKRK